MTDGSLYWHIYVYRIVMSVLYRGRYRTRFTAMTDLFSENTRSVCDLCFGDTVIADWCRARGIRWTGADINPGFCDRARRRGFEVLQGDVLALDLPRADVFVLGGSLYYFHDRLPMLFDAIMQRTDRLILSEPTRNVSSLNNALGRWARRATSSGAGPAAFRYDDRTLVDAIGAQQARLGFSYQIVSCGRDMLIDVRR